MAQICRALRWIMHSCKVSYLKERNCAPLHSIMSSSGEPTLANADTKSNAACLRTDINVNGTCDPFSVWIKNLKNTITEEIIDDKTRADAIGRIARLDPAYHFEDEDDIAEHWAMLNESSPLISNRRATLVQQLQATGCAVQGSPYVFRQLLDRFGTFDTKESARLAEAFLDDQHCPGAKGMTEAEKATLKQMRQDEVFP